jgi:hypothetical protein
VPNKLYAGLPDLKFTGGPGYLMLLKYRDSPVGPYNELAYIPGKYTPGKCSTPIFSVQRIWVDSNVSVDGGRTNWGLPKVRAGGHKDGNERHLVSYGSTVQFETMQLSMCVHEHTLPRHSAYAS